MAKTRRPLFVNITGEVVGELRVLPNGEAIGIEAGGTSAVTTGEALSNLNIYSKHDIHGISGDLDKILRSLTGLTIDVAVDPNTLSDKHVLVYQKGQAKWVNQDFTIENLSGVSVTGAYASQFLRFNGTGWANETLDLPEELNDLNDIVLSSPTNNQILQYNGAQWVNTVLSNSALTGNLGALDDVNLAGAVSGQFLFLSGNIWRARDLNVDSTFSGQPDVVLTNLNDEQVLEFDVSTQKWVNAYPTLEKLADVNITTLGASDVGKLFRWNGVRWTAANQNLGDLFNVSSKVPSTGEVLKWNPGAARWEPGADLTGAGGSGSGGGGGSLNNIVEDSTPQLGGHLDFNTYTIIDGPTDSKVLSFTGSTGHLDVNVINQWVQVGNAASGQPAFVKAIGYTGATLNLDAEDKVLIKGNQILETQLISLRDDESLFWNATGDYFFNKKPGIDTLTGLSLINPSNDDIIVYRGTGLINQPHLHNVGDLNDTSITSPVDGESLVYQAGQWVNLAVTGSGGSINLSLISDLSDVGFTGIRSGDVLTRSGNVWTNHQNRLDNLLDVQITGDPLLAAPKQLNDRSFLNYSETRGKWQQRTPYLSDLGDVSSNVDSAAANSILKHNGSKFTADEISLDELSDVDLTNIGHQRALTYNVFSGAWVPETLTGLNNINRLGGTSGLISAKSGEAMVFDGKNWTRNATYVHDHSLSELLDVSITTTTTGDFLRVSPIGGRWQAIQPKINHLIDVNVTNPTPISGQGLKWDSTQGKWVPGTFAGGGGGGTVALLSDVGNVESTAPNDNQSLIYNDDTNEYENRDAILVDITNHVSGQYILFNGTGYINSEASLDFRDVTTDYPIKYTDDVILADGSAIGGGITVSLPAPGKQNAGKEVTVKRVNGGSNGVVVDVLGGSLIEGVANISLGSRYAYRRFFSDGRAWYIVGSG